MFKFSQQHITVFRNKRYFELSMLIAYFLEKASIAHILKTVNEDTINKTKINDIPPSGSLRSKILRPTQPKY